MRLGSWRSTSKNMNLFSYASQVDARSNPTVVVRFSLHHRENTRSYNSGCSVRMMRFHVAMTTIHRLNQTPPTQSTPLNKPRSVIQLKTTTQAQRLSPCRHFQSLRPADGFFDGSRTRNTMRVYEPFWANRPMPPQTWLQTMSSTAIRTMQMR